LLIFLENEDRQALDIHWNSFGIIYADQKENTSCLDPGFLIYPVAGAVKRKKGKE